MKTRVFILSLLVIPFVSFSQELETLGSGIINFLLTNPQTANRTNATEAAALNVIGDLLSISAQRKHEMNVAELGKSEIIVNATDGNQAKIFQDIQGNIYLLFNGLIYPIAKTLVEEAKDINPDLTVKGSSLQPYNLLLLKSEYKFDKNNETFIEYELNKDKETLDEIAEKFDVTKDKIFLKKINNPSKGSFHHISFWGLENKNYFIKISDKETKPSGFACSACRFTIYVKIKIYQTKIVTCFTCNWARDFDGDGFDIKDFQNIKRSFYEGEPILFVMGYTTESKGTWELNIYESLTGQAVYHSNGNAKDGAQIVTTEIEESKLVPGVYIINFTLINDKNENISKSEKFEILSKS